MGGHYISLSVTTQTPEQFQAAWAWMNRRADELGASDSFHGYPGISISSTLMDDNVEPDVNELYYDEYTLVKVRSALKRVLDDTAIDVAINEMLNRGILFRERSKES